MWTLGAFDTADPEDAVAVLTTCCASRAWAEKVASGRPYRTVAALRAAALAGFDELPESELAVAHAAHAPIGKPKPAGEDQWSRGEQSRALAAGATVHDELAAANAAYERRFGRVFLICATGLTGEEILAEARRRLGNDDATEHREAVAELRKIVALRLEKAVRP
ncbi:2-oxo-4-hydroxy-4-carboxy-5-ureidoimidazoline decarboxylase [Glycomyces algeriensis]|uniref:2-oxo-4-hydroxy-4-carboxy-5-ureidoimidazoline decarboxylase n=1 Tax=Glycomyces algeriensis TaxID=256037 RepID=A0A9W6LFV3_9ACTN|nr:2-oxo-4-hydroxy-4-carboxy-5-ureidoimidazoline decarboxylase [Glycomyces algeriensis]MDA1365935.1 2-oxo-4-hydroxy-4-carboxy-5-ureidoimidazoline decarboxylase [Glycomyces algeriensis]MDR7349298.1 2-oxo-4-hydroxy-4-carboxy-5-ureidoimidazoline decarboxylase [Glycomyces algeriensis]GLI41998.1 2-oxo-4-hydroxy-4-carboxy-5-ureidoimidazoline decarboxylase [Glycomyces algeriensis]